MNVKTIALGVVVALVLIVGSQSLFVVNEFDQAIVMQFGAHQRTVQEPGLHFKLPFVQTIHRYDRRVLMSDSSPSEYLTLDRKRIIVDHVSRWRIADPLQFYRTVRTTPGALSRLDDIITSQLRQEVARHEFLDLIQEQREAIMAAVTRQTVVSARAFGIEILDVRIKRADLPDEVQASVFDRMREERRRIANRYRAEGDELAREIRAEADKEVEIILANAYERAQMLRGEGDALSIAIFADAYNLDPEFFAFQRSLEAYGRILGDNSTTLVLPADSPLFRYLESAY